MDGHGGETPPSTPPSSPLQAPRVDLSSVPRYVHSEDDARQPLDGPLSPLSPTSASVSVSASAVSATEQPRFQFPEMSASIDATPMPRYLGRYGADGGAGGGGSAADGDDDVEAELRRMAQRQLPRGDLGRLEWRLDSSGAQAPSGVPRSPTDSIRSGVSAAGSAMDGGAGMSLSLPRPPASPPSSPRSASRSQSVSASLHGSAFPTSAPPQEQTPDLAGAVVWGHQH
ncbi:hypothetical protein PINS_up021521 [Pythium insidiosum]|nr:hypothetical protein PINS_up021521 [Pythium insidiosum]